MMRTKILSEKSVTGITNFISNSVKNKDAILMVELYPLFTYTGLGFCVLIGLSWAISLLDKTGEA